MNKEYLAAKKKFDKYSAIIEGIRSKCSHSNYDILDNYNDHDGWSIVNVTWYQTRKCLDCENIFNVITGIGRP